MVVAISGINGFLGSHLREFFEGENEVYGIPRELLQDKIELANWFYRKSVNVIIHCAAYGNMSSQKDEEEIFKANVIGTWNLLQASKYIPHRSLIVIGSSSEYGKREGIFSKQFMNESDCPVSEDFYSATKTSATYLTQAFAKEYMQPAFIVRPFSIYGEGEADFRFIPTVCRSILKGEVLHLDPNVKHDWIHIDDVVSAISKIVDSDSIKFGTVFNVGTGIEIKNTKIVDLIANNSLCFPRTVLSEEFKRNENSHWKADINSMHSLGWEPKISIAVGLRRVWEYEKDKYDRS